MSTVTQQSRPNSIIDRRGQRELTVYFEILRDGEAALRRLLSGQSEIGDASLLRAANLGDYMQRNARDPANDLERTRLETVADMLNRSGTETEFRASEQKLKDVKEHNASEIPQLDREAKRLQQQLDLVKSQIKRLRFDESEASALHNGRVRARRRLRSDSLLPGVVVSELKMHRLPAGSKEQAESARLKLQIGQLRQDLELSPDRSMIEKKAQIYRSDQTHRGYAFWKDHQPSPESWDEYRAWCSERIESLQSEIDAIEHRIDNGDSRYVQALKGFYTDTIR